VEGGLEQLEQAQRATRRKHRKFSVGRTMERTRKRGKLVQVVGRDLRPERNQSGVDPKKQFIPGIDPGKRTRIPNERKGNHGIGLEKKIGLKTRIANGKKTDLARDPKTELESGTKIDLGIGLEKKIGLKTRIANREKIDRENGPEKETGPKIKITKRKKIDRGLVIEVKKPSQNIVNVVVPEIEEEEGEIIQNMPNN